MPENTECDGTRQQPVLCILKKDAEDAFDVTGEELQNPHEVVVRLTLRAALDVDGEGVLDSIPLASRAGLAARS